ncbi:MAG: hypothetical protein M3R25_10625, partial [Bacteroidota bacterium]|nr:hypothetical protein [Bacteroidota bacterium]
NTQHSLSKFHSEIFPKAYYSLFKESNGRLWFSSGGVTYDVYNAAGNQHLKSIPVLGFPTALVEDLHSGTIWLTTTIGLYEIDKQTLVISRLYNESNGFPASNFSSMLMDAKGHLWLASLGDLIDFNPLDKSTHTYSQEDGLPASSFNLFSAIQLKNGEMWFGSPEGITAFYPDQLKNVTYTAQP